MDHLAVVRRAFVVALLGLCSQAFAYVQRADIVFLYAGTPYVTGDAACRAAEAAGALGAYIFDSWVQTGGQAPNKTGQCKGHTASNPTYITGVTTQNGGCPSGFNGNSVTGFCEKTVTTCPSPSTPDANGICSMPPPCPAAGTNQGKWGDAWTSGSSEPVGGLTICVGGCLATGAASGKSGSGPWEIWGPLTHTGQQCNGNGAGAPPVANPDPTPPPPGYCRGEVNGNTVTVPCSDGTSDGPKVNDTTGKSDGSGTNENTTSNTTCKDGICTTTTNTNTTTTGAGGSGGGTGTGNSTKTQSQDSYCADHPKDPLCKGTEDGSFGGACAGGFTCDGDAVQCAIAKEQHIRNCEFFAAAPNSDPAVMAAAAGVHPADHPYTTAQQTPLSFSSGIDQTELLSGGCPANQSFTAGGRSFVVPFGTLCTPLGWLGNVLVALAFLACMFIVFGKAET